MPTVEVPGLGIVEFPDNMREADMQRAIANTLNPPKERSGADNFWIGLGGGMTDLGLGAKQRLYQFLQHVGDVSPAEMQALNADIASRRELMQPVMDTGAGKAGYMGGQAALAAPTAFIPGANTLTGAALLGGALGASQPTVGGESATLNTALGAGLGAGGQKVANMAGGAASRWLGNRQQAVAQQQAQNAVRDATVTDALQAGYSLPPSVANPNTGVFGNLLEGLSGKIKTTQRAAQKNQAVTNAIARRELGLAADVPLTPATFQAVRDQAFQAGYAPIKQAGQIVADAPFAQQLAGVTQPVAKLSADFPNLAKSLQGSMDDILNDLSKGAWDADNLVFAIRQYRKAASSLLRSDNPVEVAKGHASKQAATMLEDLIERNLQSQGQAGMVQQFRSARQLMAKSFDVEDAVNPGSGNVRAATLGNKLDRGKPLTGGLETIAKTERAFRGNQLSGNPLQEQTSSATPWSVLDVLFGGGMSAVDPRVAGMVLGRPLARELILSQPYQRMFANPSYPKPWMPGAASNLLNWQPAQYMMRTAPLGALTTE